MPTMCRLIAIGSNAITMYGDSWRCAIFTLSTGEIYMTKHFSVLTNMPCSSAQLETDCISSCITALADARLSPCDTRVMSSA